MLDDFEERLEGLGALIRPTVLWIARVKVHDRCARLGGAKRQSAISLGVTGRCGDIEGVWIEPVTAQLMMTFPLAMALSPMGQNFFGRRRPTLAEPFTAGRRSDGDQGRRAFVVIKTAEVRSAVFGDDDVRIHPPERNGPGTRARRDARG